MITRSRSRNSFLIAAVCMAPLVAFGADDAGNNSGNAPYNQTAAGDAAAPALSSPQYNNEVGVSVQDVVGRNTAQFGRYNGFTTQGIDLLGEFGLHWRGGRWDARDASALDTRYFDLTGDDLVYQSGSQLANEHYINGLGDFDFTSPAYTSGTSNNIAPNGSIGLNVGNRGTWAVNVYGRSISYTGNVVDSLYTTTTGGTVVLNNGLVPFGGATNVPPLAGVLPAAFTPAKLTADMDPIQTGTRRNILGVQSKYISGGWTFVAEFRTEHKEGTLEESLRESWGGQAFALPVDYNTDRYDFTAAYNVRRFQASIQYTYSHFVDNYAGVFLAYPASVASAVPAVPNAESGAYSLPPSTDAHFLTLMAAFNPQPQTRINLNARYGLELQNASFVPNTGDPGISAADFAGFANLNSALEGTRNDSLNGIAQVFHSELAFTSRPMDALDSHAFASVDGRRVQIGEHTVYTGGVSPDANARTAAYVVPQEWTKSKLGGDVSYRLWRQYDTKLGLGYQFEDVDRSNAQVEHSTTDTESVRIASNLPYDMRGVLSYALDNRSGSLNYVTPWVNLGTTASEAAPSGAYYQAPMTAGTAKLRLDYSATEDVSAGLTIQYRKEDYHYPGIAPGTNLVDSVEGIKQDRKVSVSPDLSYAPGERLDVNLFYTYEDIYYDNVGNGECANSTGIPAAGNLCTGSAGYFKNDYSSRVQTVGAGLHWKATSRLKLQGTYTYSYGTVAFSEYNGVFVSSVTQSYQNVQNYPDIDSIMQALTLKAEYQIDRNKELIFGYSFNFFENNDWNDFSNPVQTTTNTGSAISILTPGYATPNYRVSTIGVGIKIRW